ncbi:hypothetical protein MnTg01_01247 [archaeon MnTg01]|nr:hypothetical protein MnTg01_01247 [archaeon MnTg01]
MFDIGSNRRGTKTGSQNAFNDCQSLLILKITYSSLTMKSVLLVH